MNPQPQQPRAPTTRSDGGCFFQAVAAFGENEGTASLHVAVVSSDEDVVLQGFERFPSTCLVLLHRSEERGRASRLADRFASAGVSPQLREVGPTPYLDVLRDLNALLDEAPLTHEQIFLNLASGTPADGCALTTAAYLHGTLAFHLTPEPMLLPTLRYTHHATLSSAKVRVLHELARARRPLRPRALAKRARQPIHELEDHLSETHAQGLLRLGLVEERIGRFGHSRFTLSASAQTLLASDFLPASTV